MSATLQQLISIFAAIVTLATVFTIVSQPGTAKIIQAFGSTFSDSLRAATGR